MKSVGTALEGMEMDELAARSDQKQVKIISRKSPDYKLEFVNGELSNITPRGEIVCDFHLEFKDMPNEQLAEIVEKGKATLLPMQEPITFTRDVKFGIVMNAQFAKDLVRMIGDKITECEENILEKGEKVKNA